MVACLKSLLGDEVSSIDMLEENITAKAFAENLLGFEDYEESGVGVTTQATTPTDGDGQDAVMSTA